MYSRDRKWVWQPKNKIKLVLSVCRYLAKRTICQLCCTILSSNCIVVLKVIKIWLGRETES